MGTENGTLEMLFIAPKERGKGLGKRLLRYGIDHLGVKKLAVNEQNPQAKGFYEHMGFRACKRTERDEQGWPLSACVHAPAGGKRRFFAVTREGNCRLPNGTLKDI